MKNILIGGAWPYANGSLHIGHAASLLPGDVIARFHRAAGNQVYYVSGSDCYGTPIMIRAKEENKLPEEISDFYHEEFCRIFDKLGFSYDLYSKTTAEHHKKFVQEFHKRMYDSEYIYEATALKASCKKCSKVLTDRMVIGLCPECGSKTRGDQCESCDSVLEPSQLQEPVCHDCGNAVEFEETKHLYIALSKMEEIFTEYLSKHEKWRKNAYSFTKRYIDEGLRDRAVTRDIDWGIEIPKEGYEDKRIYIWAENVLGYLSVSAKIAEERGLDYKELFSENAVHYYVHGKDNIPFHSIILPALMIAHKENVHLPDEIISSEYLTLEGRKISTSHRWAVWVKDLVDKYNPDSLRYFFIANGPEKRDTDFSFREFVERNNGELLGGYGNFINRTLAFVNKYFNNKIPSGSIEPEIMDRIKGIYVSAGEKIEKGNLKDALDEIFELVRFGNKYFDENKPWATRESDAEKCGDTIYNCVQIIANLSVLLNPFLPFSSVKVRSWFEIDNSWRYKCIEAGTEIPAAEILFERLDKKIIEEELQKLEDKNN